MMLNVTVSLNFLLTTDRKVYRVTAKYKTFLLVTVDLPIRPKVKQPAL